MVNAYDFLDDEQSTDLGDIGKKLSQASKSKDSLIKLLKVNTHVSGLCFQDMFFGTLNRLRALWFSKLAKLLRKHLKRMLVQSQPQRLLQKQL